MRAVVFVGRLALAAACTCMALPITASAAASQGNAGCPCNSADEPEIGSQSSEGANYRYRDWPAVHGPSQAPQPATAEPVGLVIDQDGWSGGVGYGEDDGSGDGQVMLTGSVAQSFQQNPGMARPFRNRLLGGFAPAR